MITPVLGLLDNRVESQPPSRLGALNEPRLGRKEPTWLSNQAIGPKGGGNGGPGSKTSCQWTVVSCWLGGNSRSLDSAAVRSARDDSRREGQKAGCIILAVSWLGCGFGECENRSGKQQRIRKVVDPLNLDCGARVEHLHDQYWVYR